MTKKASYVTGTIFMGTHNFEGFKQELIKKAMWVFIGGIEKTQNEKEHWHFMAYNKKRPTWGWITKRFKIHYEPVISPKDCLKYCQGYKDGKFKNGIGENDVQEEYGTRPRLVLSDPIEVAADYRKLDDEDAA